VWRKSHLALDVSQRFAFSINFCAIPYFTKLTFSESADSWNFPRSKNFSPDRQCQKGGYFFGKLQRIVWQFVTLKEDVAGSTEMSTASTRLHGITSHKTVMCRVIIVVRNSFLQEVQRTGATTVTVLFDILNSAAEKTSLNNRRNSHRLVRQYWKLLDFLKHDFHSKDSKLTSSSQRTQSVSITKVNGVMLCREITYVIV
jgi:hypothetical protein